MAEPHPIAVVFSEAIEALRRRVAIGADEWQQILAEEGVTASLIAEDMVTSVVEDLARAALDALEQGSSLEMFRKDYDRIVKASGWSYKGDSGWHSELVFRMHTGMATAAGRWEQAQRLQAAQPGRVIYARYVTVGDHRVRPTHQEWQGIILPITHPFWQTHWPPNGFNCRCTIQIVLESDLRRYGWTVTPDNDPRLAVPPDQGWEFNPGVASERIRKVEEATAKA